MSLDKQINAIKEVYREYEKAGEKTRPVIVGKFALTVYTQGMYPANIISLLHPDIVFLEKVLSNLGYKKFGDLWLRDDINIEVSKDFKLITGILNQIEVDKEEVFNVLSLEDLILDMMVYCVEGDDFVCDLIKLIVKSYYKVLDFHYIYQKINDRRFIPKLKAFKKEAEEIQ